MKNDRELRKQIVELLKGGFAPNIILLREFPADKAGIVLEGLHFSAWLLLGHIHARHNVFLNFIKDPDSNPDVWPEAFWPENRELITSKEWKNAIDDYKKDLDDFMALIEDVKNPLLKIYGNGKTVSWAALTVIHHTGYHIGQLKTIGRQLGVW